MAECIKCGSYTKFNNGLCYDCYQNNDGAVQPLSTKSSNNTADNSSINKTKVNHWVENVIKGRIAETIIEELFHALGFQVFKFGMENTIPGIKELLKGVKGEVALEIKRMPDLVVFKNNKAHFIEVKFRASESFKLSDINEKGEYPYQNALFVIVSRKHIKCISYEELAKGKEITATCHNFLGSRGEFETDKEIIIEYCKHAVRFFENV
ncbi:MAG: hypothetical protein ACLQQ4_09710 [Bacteroidia bacterium]